MALPLKKTVIRALKRLAWKLVLARMKRRWSQRALAARLGISVYAIRRLECGVEPLDLGRATRIAVDLGLWPEVNRLFELLADPKGCAPTACRKVTRHASAPKIEDASGRSAPYEGDIESLGRLMVAVEGGHASVEQSLQARMYAKPLGDGVYRVLWGRSNDRPCIVKLAFRPEGVMRLRAELLAMKLALSARLKCLSPQLKTVGGYAYLVADPLVQSRTGSPSARVQARDLMGVRLPHRLELLDLATHVQQRCRSAVNDLRELWMRLVFMRVIHQPHEDLTSIVFEAGQGGELRLGPAFGLRLYPTPITEVDERLTSLAGEPVDLMGLVRRAPAFGLDLPQVRSFLSNLMLVINDWKYAACNFPVSMSWTDLRSFELSMNATKEMISRASSATYSSEFVLVE